MFNPDILFGTSQRAPCTDPRDKIYGLLGIIEGRDMPIDYTNSMFQVYKDMIQHIINPDLRYLVFAHRSVNTNSISEPLLSVKTYSALLGGPFQNPLDFVGRARANGYHYSPIIKVGPVIDEQSALKSLIALFDYSAFDRIGRWTALRRGDVRTMAQKFENRWKDMTKLKSRIQPITPYMWSAKIYAYDKALQRHIQENQIRNRQLAPVLISNKIQSRGFARRTGIDVSS